MEFWKDKFDKNVARDRKNLALLKETGWRAIVLWECEIANVKGREERLDKLAEEILKD